MSRYQWRRDKSNWQTDTAQKPGNHLECHLTHFKRNSSRLKPLKCPQEWNQCSKTFICQVRSFQPVVQLICGSLGGCKWPSLELISCISRIWDALRSALACAGWRGCDTLTLTFPCIISPASRGQTRQFCSNLKLGRGKTWIFCIEFNGAWFFCPVYFGFLYRLFKPTNWC